MTNTENAISPMQFLSEVRQIALDRFVTMRRDYVYRRQTTNLNAGTCLYVHDSESGESKPGCIIGYWLHTKHGVALGDLRVCEGCSASGMVTAFVTVESDTLQVMNQLQVLQDEGTPWLEAVTGAERFYLQIVLGLELED